VKVKTHRLTDGSGMLTNPPSKSFLVLASGVMSVVSVLVTVYICFRYQKVIPGNIIAALMLVSCFQFFGVLVRPFQYFNFIRRTRKSGIQGDGAMENDVMICTSLGGLTELQAISTLLYLCLLVCLQVLLSSIGSIR
jgi:hypothetical protein